MIRATFVMEQHLGHQTYYQNLRRFVEAEAQVNASWVPLDYREAPALWERLPWMPAGVRGSLRGRHEVRRGLADHPADVFFFNTQVPAALGGALSRSRPYVIATDLTPIQYDQISAQYQHRPDRFGPLKAYKHLANVRTLRGAACLLPWSSWARQSMIDDYGVDPARIEVLPPGVDTQLWRPGQGQRSGPLRILFVGGDFARKGGELLLEAFRALPPGSAELHVVTRSQLSAERGVLIYQQMRPNSPELIELYQRSDLFVLPTNAEAFGIAAAEACASGLPVIATAVGGVTDIVADGETGFLIAPGDGAALVGHLRRLADDEPLRRRLAQAARQRAERLFDARRNAARAIACLQRAAAGAPYGVSVSA